MTQIKAAKTSRKSDNRATEKTKKRRGTTKKPQEDPPKIGRPSTYSVEIAERLCEKIATTTYGLRRICNEDETLPSVETIRRWLYRDEGGFCALYARAKEKQQELIEEELLEIADDGTNDTYVDSEGRPKVDHDHIQRSKLRIETRKWLMAKLKPKKYGDKVDLNHGGQAENPLTMLLEQVQGTRLKPGGGDQS